MRGGGEEKSVVPRRDSDQKTKGMLELYRLKCYQSKHSVAKLRIPFTFG